MSVLIIGTSAHGIRVKKISKHCFVTQKIAYIGNEIALGRPQRCKNTQHFHYCGKYRPSHACQELPSRQDDLACPCPSTSHAILRSHLALPSPFALSQFDRFFFRQLRARSIEILPAHHLCFPQHARLRCTLDPNLAVDLAQELDSILAEGCPSRWPREQL